MSIQLMINSKEMLYITPDRP